jgi:organic hydroperoxide reductase OsmC/OhrA
MADIFRSHLVWSGATKGPTRDPITFSRNMDVSFEAATLPMSAAPGYRGDPLRANPEELFVASVSACQALTFLFLCAKKGIVVIGYADDAEGRLAVIDGRMRMSEIILRPHITLERGTDESGIQALIDRADDQCFIANSISASVDVIPSVVHAEVPAPVSSAGAEIDESC